MCTPCPFFNPQSFTTRHLKTYRAAVKRHSGLLHPVGTPGVLQEGVLPPADLREETPSEQGRGFPETGTRSRAQVRPEINGRSKTEEEMEMRICSNAWAWRGERTGARGRRRIENGRRIWRNPDCTSMGHSVREESTLLGWSPSLHQKGELLLYAQAAAPR